MLVEKLIGKQLRKQREKEKLNVTLIARRLNISERTIFRFEKGSNLHLGDTNKLMKICNAYNTDLIEVKKEAEADFVQNYSGSNAFTLEELDRYRNTFEALNKAVLEQMRENEQESRDALLDLITKKFEQHRIFGRQWEKEDLTEVINLLIDTKIKQIKRNQ